MVMVGRRARRVIAVPVMGMAVAVAATVTANASETAAKQSSFDYQIRVHYEGPKGFLTLHNRKGREVVRYPVALPRTMPKYLPARGRIAGTLRKPVWYPTKNICRETPNTSRTPMVLATAPSCADSPPTQKPGSCPQDVSSQAMRVAVVVLPWVPDTATPPWGGSNRGSTWPR